MGKKGNAQQKKQQQQQKEDKKKAAQQAKDQKNAKKQEQQQQKNDNKKIERMTKREMKRQREKVDKQKGKNDDAKFLKQLEPMGLKVVETKGDGNCMFRAVADQLKGDQNYHKEFRKQAVKYLIDNADTYKFFIEDDETIEDYCKDMAKDGIWGGQIELNILANIYHFNCIVHQVDNPSNGMVFVPPIGSVPTIHISYHMGEHYNSVRRFDDPGFRPAISGDFVVGHELEKVKQIKNGENIQIMEIINNDEIENMLKPDDIEDLKGNSSDSDEVEANEKPYGKPLVEKKYFEHENQGVQKGKKYKQLVKEIEEQKQNEQNENKQKSGIPEKTLIYAQIKLNVHDKDDEKTLERLLKTFFSYKGDEINHVVPEDIDSNFKQIQKDYNDEILKGFQDMSLNDPEETAVTQQTKDTSDNEQEESEEHEENEEEKPREKDRSKNKKKDKNKTEEPKGEGETGIIGKESGLNLDQLNNQLKELNKETMAVDPDYQQLHNLKLKQFPGKNGHCPCGSRQKFRKCCLQRWELTKADVINQIEDELLKNNYQEALQKEMKNDGIIFV